MQETHSTLDITGKTRILELIMRGRGFFFFSKYRFFYNHPYYHEVAVIISRIVRCEWRYIWCWWKDLSGWRHVHPLSEPQIWIRDKSTKILSKLKTLLTHWAKNGRQRCHQFVSKFLHGSWWPKARKVIGPARKYSSRVVADFDRRHLEQYIETLHRLWNWPD